MNKLIALMTSVLSAGTAFCAATTHLSLDCREGVREICADGEELRYDVGWYADADQIRIMDDVADVETGTAGSVLWYPESDKSAPHVLVLEALRNGQVVATETAEFALGYIRNVTARQLWPHKKVEVCYEIAEDIGEVADENSALVLTCGEGTVAPELTFTSDSSYPFTSDSGLYKGCGPSHKSGGYHVSNAKSTMCCTVSGATQVSFWWRVSSESNYDKLKFYVDGTEKTTAISGDVDWTLVTVGLSPSSSHALKWSYEKDGSDDSGSDCGWVDCIDVKYASTAVPAKTVLGDTRCVPGAHSVVWDMEADGAEVKENHAIFRVKVVAVNEYPQSCTKSQNNPIVSDETIVCGVSRPARVDTSSSCVDGMVVAGTMTLEYSPIDAGRVSLEVNGREVLLATESGAFEWTPDKPGTYVLTHRAGENVFTRRVVCPAADDAKELEIGWLDEPLSNVFSNVYASVTNVTLAPVLRDLPKDAFAGCEELAVSQKDGFVIYNDWLLGYIGEAPAEVVVPEGVKGIASFAFEGQAWLERVTLPSTLKYIGANAFRACTGLECVELPEGLVSVGDGAFRDCTWMQEVTFPESLETIGDLAFGNCSMLEGIECCDGLQVIGEGAFSNCWRMLSVALPASVDEIGARAFYNCKNLLGVTVPAHVETLANLFPDVYQSILSVTIAEGESELIAGIFGGCQMLEEVELSDAIREIPDSAFEGCLELRRIRFPNELVRIGHRAFFGCSKIDQLEFPAGLQEIGDDAFNGLPQVRDLKCPASVRKIGARAFKGVWNDEEIKLPEGLEALGADAFADCSSIRRIALSAVATPVKSAFPAAYSLIDSVTILGAPETIAPDFCRDVVQLVGVQIPSTVTNIGSSAFAGLPNLAEITLPPNLRTIGEQAFCGDVRLTAVDLPQSLEAVGAEAFEGCSNVRTVSCPGEVGTLSALFPSAYGQITVVSINRGTERLMDYLLSGCAKLAQVDLPGGVTNVGARAFKDCVALTAFGVPNGVVTLGEDAFSGCTGLTSMSLPEGLETISAGAFRNCRGISSIVIPSTVAFIGADAFNGCSVLRSVSFLGWCPQFDGDCYNGTPTELVSYVINGSRGWDGIPTSRALPEYWPTANGRTITYWEPNTFEVTFDGNGGTPSSSVVVQTTGMTYVLPEDDPVMESASFAGWWTQPVNGGQIKSVTKVEVTRAQTFYAHWKYHDYAVRFDANGGFGEMANQPFTVNTPGELSANRFLRKDCRFAGWALTPEGEVAFADGAEVENLSLEQDAVVVLYAVWEDEPWGAADYLNAPGLTFGFAGDADWIGDDEVSHDGIGSLRSGAIPAADEGRQTTSVLRTTVVGEGSGSFWWKVSCEPDDAGDYYDYCSFTVDGVDVAKIAGVTEWAKVDYEVTGEGEHVLVWTFVRDDWDEDETRFENAAWVDEFVWTPTPVTLSFDAGGAEGAVPLPITKSAGAEVVLPTPSLLTKAGMEFVGWSDGERQFAAGEVYRFGAEDVVLVAVWREKVWTLEEAANLTGFALTTGGDANWVVDLATNYDGVAAIRSGTIGDSQDTWVSMAVDGPGTVGFRVFVSGEYNRGKLCDYLKFEVDGIQEFASYDADWSNVVVTVVGTGAHTLKWTYLKNTSKSVGADGAWLDEIVWTPSAEPEVKPTVEGDEGATVTGDAETGFVIKPSDGKTLVEVTIPQGVDAAKVTVEVSPKVESVKPNGAKMKIVSGGADITEFLNVPAADGNGVVDLTKATVKEEIVKETLDTAKGAVVELNAADSKLTTAPTRAGLFYQLREGETLGGMKDGDSKVGDGQPWSPEIKVKGGKSGFYSIGVGKCE